VARKRKLKVGDFVKFRYQGHRYEGKITATTGDEIEVLVDGGDPQNDNDYFVVSRSEPSLMRYVFPRAIPPLHIDYPAKSKTVSRPVDRGDYKIVDYGTGPKLGVVLGWSVGDKAAVDLGFAILMVPDISLLPDATPSQIRRLKPALQKGLSIMRDKPPESRRITSTAGLKAGDPIIWHGGENNLYTIVRVNPKSLRVTYGGDSRSTLNLNKYYLYTITPREAKEHRAYTEEARKAQVAFSDPDELVFI